MRVSVFTPTHDPSYLGAAYKELKDQPFDEWLLLLNGSVNINDIPMSIISDPRVNLVYTQTVGSVGALKREACSLCSGDVLVELDHDDLLISPGIQRVREAFVDPNVVFAYTNCAYFMPDGFWFPGRDAQNGWVERDFEHNGKTYREIVSPDPHPCNVSTIHYAPDHLRAFRKDAYLRCGGHDPRLDVLDDSNVMCKIFCEGEFKHVDECCYLYRVHLNNTWIKRQEKIDANLLNDRREYFPQMVDAWAARNGLKTLELGAYFNSELECCESDSVGVVKINDVPELQAEGAIMAAYRALTPGGILFFMLPRQDVEFFKHYTEKNDENSNVRFFEALVEIRGQDTIAFLVALKRDSNGNELNRVYGRLLI